MLMRYHGVHVLDFPSFLTTAHNEEDVDRIIEAIELTCAELRASGFMPERLYRVETINRTLTTGAAPRRERIVRAMDAPVPGARLGRSAKGEAAWFLPDPHRAGKYLMIEEEV